jgi:hypothetical protein
MRHDVWVEPGKVSQQFGKVVQHESGELENVTEKVFCQSLIATCLAWSLPGNHRRTTDQLMTLDVFSLEHRSLNQQEVTV